MRLAALLPLESIDHVQKLLSVRQTAFTTSHIELGELLRAHPIEAVLIDPQANGDKTDVIVGMMRRYRRARFIAYVKQTGPSLRAVFRLSSEGLDDVFLHPVEPGDQRFRNAIDRIEADSLASDALAAVEHRFEQLPPPVMEAVLDLFHRPYRYQSSTDLADEAGISIRSLYRALEDADFATARQLISMAKVIHGYCYLRAWPATVGWVSSKLGYPTVDAFDRDMLRYLRIRSTGIGTITREHALLHIIEEFHKPREVLATCRSLLHGAPVHRRRR
jgi:hypothetical protein